MPSQAKQVRPAFTLVELLVVIAILGLLMGLLFPAVQAARESARRVHCGRNLAQQGIGLLQFESSYRCLPPGAEGETLHAWGTRILPYLELDDLYQQIDRQAAWDAPRNLSVTRQNLSVFICPTSLKNYDGRTDYCGIRGSSHKATNDGSRNGILFHVSPEARPVVIASIADGTSNTMAIAEGIAVGEDNFGFWSCGVNCIGHEEGPINNRRGSLDEIASLHPNGANTVFADGSVRFLSESMSLDVVAALCTRDNREVVPEF